MSEFKQLMGEFSGTNVMPMLIDDATLASLLQTRDVEQEGVPDLLRKLIKRQVPLDDPLVGMVLSESDLVRFAFWADEPDFIEAARGVLRGEQAYERIIMDGIWSRAWTWLGDFDVESVHKSTAGLRLPIAEIHSPHVEGCVGTFATTRAGSLDVSIKAFGLGYGRVKRVAIGHTYEVPSACRRLTTGVQFEVRVWKHKFSDKRRALVRVISIDGTVIDEPLDVFAQHPCGSNYRESAARIHAVAQLRGQNVGQEYSDVPMHDATKGAVSTHSIKLEAGSVYSVSLELPLTWFPGAAKAGQQISKLGINIESRVSKTIEMSWKLVSGHDYMRFRGVRGDMRMFWVWE